MNACVGDIIDISLTIDDGNVDVHPRVTIYDNNNVPMGVTTLFHDANGRYVPASDYTMPDREYISLVYIVYEDAGYQTESADYARSTATYIKVVPAEFKANVSGLATLNEYDARMTAIQLDLDTPNQYKANVSGLATLNEYDTVLGEIKTETDKLPALILDVALLQEWQGGRWKLDAATNIMTFYKADNITVIAEFDLTDSNGVPAVEDVFERTRR